MLLPFTKMNGAGNDFVLIDNRDRGLALTAVQIARLCDRHRGIGADGVLAVEPARHGADFRFRYYNSDGGEVEMCGNGARCFARFASRLLPDPRTVLTFETIAGTLSAELRGEQVRIAMSDPTDLVLDSGVTVEGLPAPLHVINTGVPHTVAFVTDLDHLDVLRLGAALRRHPRFQPAGTNANFAKVLATGHLAIRTYERGVENETLACGTGMVAAALVHHLLHHAPSPVRVEVRGGDTLEVGFSKDRKDAFREVTLTGPADFVFDGRIEV